MKKYIFIISILTSLMQLSTISSRNIINRATRNIRLINVMHARKLKAKSYDFSTHTNINTANEVINELKSTFQKTMSINFNMRKKLVIQLYDSPFSLLQHVESQFLQNSKMFKSCLNDCCKYFTNQDLETALEKTIQIIIHYSMQDPVKFNDIKNIIKNIKN